MSGGTANAIIYVRRMKKTIVIVEDDAAVGFVYQTYLKREGFEVELATDGEAGLARILRCNPAGVLLDLSGLQPSSKGSRVKFSGGKTTVIDGPFPETKELIAGYWIIQVKSKQEAIEWAKRAPAPHNNGEGEIEIRQFFELDDFEPGPAVDRARELEKGLPNKQ